MTQGILDLLKRRTVPVQHLGQGAAEVIGRETAAQLPAVSLDKGVDTITTHPTGNVLVIAGAGALVVRKNETVVKRPPSPGDIHGVIRRARPSSRYRNRPAACVCGRWPEYGPGWIPELQGPVRNAADRGCNGFSTLRRSFSSGAR